MNQDIVKTITIFVFLLILFPALGALILESILIGVFFGIIVVIVIGLIYWYANQ
mgnify:CR=1 FL=1